MNRHLERHLFLLGWQSNWKRFGGGRVQVHIDVKTCCSLQTIFFSTLLFLMAQILNYLGFCSKPDELLLMTEILHHLGWLKPYK